ncbi:MAG: ATP:cob(I)alamin adenosyltransferase [Eggerthellaceae bacterium]|nr:ATP:cob(I)alamin adenosyltransferase [Eggerthellaceae bacterium]
MRTTVTKTGDKGQTSLFTGERVPKTSAPIEALGAVDELQAALGLAHAQAANPAVREELRDAEVMLGVMMADIADASREPRLGAPDVAALEQSVSLLAAPLPDGFSFDVPGVNVASAQLHVARTVARRCERTLWRLRDAADGEARACEGAGAADAAASGRPLVSDDAMAYLNRLSDLCFVCALIEARA